MTEIRGRGDVEAVGQDILKKKGVVSRANYRRECNRDKDRLF